MNKENICIVWMFKNIPRNAGKNCSYSHLRNPFQLYRYLRNKEKQNKIPKQKNIYEDEADTVDSEC